MGYSITHETHEKIEANRRAGRLCTGGNRYCATRATKAIRTESYAYKLGEGKMSEHVHTMCAKHARSMGMVPGAEHVNFRVISVERIQA